VSYGLKIKVNVTTIFVGFVFLLDIFNCRISLASPTHRKTAAFVCAQLFMAGQNISDKFSFIGKTVTRDGKYPLIDKINEHLRSEGQPQLYADDDQKSADFVKGRASQSASIHTWLKKGVNIEVSTPIELPQNDISHYFKSAARDRGLFIGPSYNYSFTFPNLIELVAKIEHWRKAGRTPAVTDDNFYSYYGFYPTDENLDKLPLILKDLETPTETKKISFGKYVPISDIPQFTEGTPKEFREFISAVVNLWNRPQVVLSKMRYVRKLANDIIAKDPSIDQASAVEMVRRSYEDKHGFSKKIDRSRSVMTTEAWHEFLMKGEPSQDPIGRHSFTVKELDGQNVHRDQWLVIMIAMEQNPELFNKNMTDLPATYFYKYFGKSGNDGPAPFPKKYVEIQGDGTHYNILNYWYRLFDLVGEENGPILVPNFADPVYFVEVWAKQTGFSRSW
jgi:hypothetical protein